jgi:hypothetical protein
MILSKQILFGESVLFSPQTSNETPQPASAVAGYVFDSLSSHQFDGSSEAAIFLLRELAREQEVLDHPPQESRACQRPWENSSPLQKVPPGEWRSLGGYFDYSHWVDRERFLELDKAIAASQRSLALEVEPDVPMFLTNAG